MRTFVEDFKEFSTFTRPESEDEIDNEVTNEFDENPVKVDTEYTIKGKDAVAGPPLEVSHSARFGGNGQL